MPEKRPFGEGLDEPEPEKPAIFMANLVTAPDGSLTLAPWARAPIEKPVVPEAVINNIPLVVQAMGGDATEIAKAMPDIRRQIILALQFDEVGEPLNRDAFREWHERARPMAEKLLSRQIAKDEYHRLVDELADEFLAKYPNPKPE